jgi:quercetin dioxygenase-like cupin family protein
MRALAVIAVATLLAGCGANATPVGKSAIKRTDLLRQGLGDAVHEAVQVRVDFTPKAAFGKHVHPGEEIAYVLEGSLAHHIEGSSPIVLSAGDAVFIPAGTRHAARNVAAGRSVELATYLVEKEKPLVVLTPNGDGGRRPAWTACTGNGRMIAIHIATLLARRNSASH